MEINLYNVKFHFLEESGTTLNTLDNSDFNIIISNNQKGTDDQKSSVFFFDFLVWDNKISPL